MARTEQVRALVRACVFVGCLGVIGSAHAQTDSGGPMPAPATADHPVVGASVPLGVVAGPLRPGATPFYGTDLGWTFVHDDELWVLFGDTWSSFFGIGIQPEADDTLGKISLRDFPDGDAVERWVKQHPGKFGFPLWQAGAPPVRVAVDEKGAPKPIRPVRDGKALTLGPALTPMAGFSNARSGAAAGAFALFLRNEPVRCDQAGQCGGGFSCDRDLGQCAPVDGELSAPCVLGTASCWCIRVAPGLCQDRTSSVYDDTERGRSQAVVMRQPVGNALHDDPTRFASRAWDTRRFYNATVRAVRDFDASRRSGEGNDYRPPVAGHTPAREGVFVWGRPSFGGVRANGRDAQLYLAWVPMPEYHEGGQFAWEPSYFIGLEADGRPRFGPNEVEARPLDLDASTDGHQPEEANDVVGQMAIAWVPSLGRFVMMYGGGIGTEFTKMLFGADIDAMTPDPLGSLFIRYARDPWGPWSPPERLITSGNPSRGIPGHYGPGGLLYDADCKQPLCVPGEFAFLKPNERGRLYAPNIIDPWTMARPDGATDLYWHVSTWNPYQVVLMRTRLQLPAAAVPQ